MQVTWLYTNEALDPISQPRQAGQMAQWAKVLVAKPDLHSVPRTCMERAFSSDLHMRACTYICTHTLNKKFGFFLMTLFLLLPFFHLPEGMTPPDTEYFHFFFSSDTFLSRHLREGLVCPLPFPTTVTESPSSLQWCSEGA